MNRKLLAILCITLPIAIGAISDNLEFYSIENQYNSEIGGFHLSFGVVLKKLSTVDYVDFAGYFSTVTTFDLMELEKRADFYNGSAGHHYVPLQKILFEIYRLCDVDRSDFIPYDFQKSQTYRKFPDDDVEEATRNATLILNQLKGFIDGTFIDTFGIKDQLNKTLNSKVGKNINLDTVRKYLKFDFELKPLGSMKIEIKVKMYNPRIIDKRNLYKINYIPVKSRDNSTVTILKGREFQYAVDLGANSFLFLEELSECEFIENILFCKLDFKKQKKGDDCLTNIIMAKRSYQLRVRYCSYEDKSKEEFTDLGSGWFHYLVENDSTYEYKCTNGFAQTDQFPKNTGLLKIGKGCIFSTAHTTILESKGVYAVFKMENNHIGQTDFWDNIPWDTVGIVGGSIFAVVFAVLFGVCFYRCRISRTRDIHRGDYETLVGSG
ncbi:hypothetical protein ACFFRR_008719 [Megaselia abdita]